MVAWLDCDQNWRKTTAMETKTQVKREMKPQDKLQRKTHLLFLDLDRLAYLQAWGADRTANIPCHPQGKQLWGGPGQ